MTVYKECLCSTWVFANNSYGRPEAISWSMRHLIDMKLKSELSGALQRKLSLVCNKKKSDSSERK